MNLLNKAVVSVLPVFPKKLVKVFANKYIAGDKIEHAVTTVKSLERESFLSTIDVLGESVSEKNTAIECKNENIEVIDAIVNNNLPAYLSVKLTMLGLDIDYDFCYGLFEEILAYANKKGVFIRIDMEDSSVTEKTITIFEKARAKYDNVGIVIQAYLKRSEDDVRRLVKIGASFRICKGIYIEPEEIAFKGKDEIRENYLKLVRIALENGSYVGMATHDDHLVHKCEKIVKELKLDKDKYEFQMLLGVREQLRDQIRDAGHRVRIYVPFGQRWYEYSIRRFQENPNVAGQVIKSIFTR
ncbi:MAG TPA: proline dehydrogenase family protein [Ignavibacteria bacterium]|nr:proline dehydrogenase family protein [Ignavibacteria bacterium]